MPRSGVRRRDQTTAARMRGRMGVASRERLVHAHCTRQRVVFAVGAAARVRDDPAHLAILAGHHDPGREGLRREVADEALDAFAAPFPERRADPVAWLATPCSDLPPQSGHDQLSEFAGRLVHRVAFGQRRPGSTELRPGGKRVAQVVPRRRSRRSRHGRSRRRGARRPRATAVLRSLSSRRFWSSPRARLSVRLRREVIGPSSSSRVAMMPSSGPGTVSSSAVAPACRTLCCGAPRPCPAYLAAFGLRLARSCALGRRRVRRWGRGRRRLAGLGLSAAGSDAREQLVDRAGRRGRTPCGVVRRDVVHRLTDDVAERLLVLGALNLRVQTELVAHRHGRGAGRLVRLVELGQDPVHPVAHPVYRRGHLVARCSQCLNVHPERAPSARQVGQHAPAGLLDLLEEDPSLVLGAGDDRLALADCVGHDPLALDTRFVLGVGHEELDLHDPLGRRRLRARLELVHLALRLAQAGWPPRPGPGPRCAPPPHGRGAGSARCAARARR